jgi:hypothetical protein
LENTERNNSDSSGLEVIEEESSSEEQEASESESKPESISDAEWEEFK